MGGMTMARADEQRRDLQLRINAGVDLLETARDRADRNASQSVRLERQEVRFLLNLVKRLEEEVNR